ncbi:MAG TPA: hypothetical protein VMT16_09600 [Thermoanaerobaculia bacterium]|nr:hypothetical protein [Thermoanaerobaculia bacterium]
MVTRPRHTLARFAANLRGYFAPADDQNFAWTHREADRCRDALVTDLANAQLVAVLALGAFGLATTWRDWRAWPLLPWFLFHAVLVNLFFHPEARYRLPTMPVAMVFAGAGLARLLGLPGGAAAHPAVERRPSLPERPG